MTEETSAPEQPPKKPPADPNEIIRDLVRPEDLEGQNESDGPRDPTTQDRGNLSLEATAPATDTRTVRKLIFIEPQKEDVSSGGDNGLER
ncbi:hypothetical protein H6F89_28990 [Cyanobacteria bacterium FACHB-63]|nr:hypothetical protein [Cyanobacteria bacterium FACHB-63]